MSFKDKLNKFISNHTETREDHSDESLKTRYYKAMKDRAFNELVAIFNDSKKFQIKSSAIERGEIIVESLDKRKVFLVATVVMVWPNRTAIDFSVTTESTLPTDFGYSANVIKELYKILDKHLEYVGSGLGKQLN